jgi:type I site-specific restriction endonuclease
MDKKALKEQDICDRFIRPAFEAAGRDRLQQIFGQYPLRAGRVVVRGRKAGRDKNSVLRADHALFFKPNIPLAVVEAKDTRVTELRRLCAALRERLQAQQATQSRLAEALVEQTLAA